MKKLVIVFCLIIGFANAAYSQADKNAGSRIKKEGDKKTQKVVVTQQPIKTVKNTKPPTLKAKNVKSKEWRKKDSIYNAWYKKAWDERDDGKSIEFWGQLIVFAPDSARPYQARGYMHNRLGNFDEAISDCDRAIAHDKNYALAYQLRGKANMGKKKWHEAVADFNIALRLNDNDIKSYMYRGQAYFEAGKPLEGCRDINKAHDLASADKNGSQDSLIKELVRIINDYCINKSAGVKK